MNPWTLVGTLIGWLLVVVLVVLLLLAAYFVVGAAVLWTRDRVRAARASKPDGGAS
jgi:hypothetical protein